MPGTGSPEWGFLGREAGFEVAAEGTRRAGQLCHRHLVGRARGRTQEGPLLIPVEGFPWRAFFTLPCFDVRVCSPGGRSRTLWVCGGGCSTATALGLPGTSLVLQRDPRCLRSNPLCGEAQHGKAFAELLELLGPSQESVPEGWGSEEKESCVTKAVLL